MRGRRQLEGGTYFKVRKIVKKVNNIKCQNLVIFSFKIRMKEIFTINEKIIMKKSKYQQYF